MNFYFKQGAFWLPVLFLLWATSFNTYAQTFSTTQLVDIGNKIFHNECANKQTCLVAWNDGEGFASLGIGHFIWFPKHKNPPFEESFPQLLQFMQAQGVALPLWLDQESPDAPWLSKKQFLEEYHSRRTQSLIQFLAQTKIVQSKFIVQRFKQALPKLLASLDDIQQSTIRDRFERIANSSQGLYSLIDYVNFKGEGSNPNERYQGQGWGLLQVLQHIDSQLLEDNPHLAFAQAAEQVLRQRVELSPPQRHEQRWLAGWLKRVQTYVTQHSKLP